MDGAEPSGTSRSYEGRAPTSTPADGAGGALVLFALTAVGWPLSLGVGVL